MKDNSKQNKKSKNNQQRKAQSPEPSIARPQRPFLTAKGSGRVGLMLFFALSWIWASWWMGDMMRIAYERSFFAADTTLMYWLWQKSFGWLWIIGRALLTSYHWPIIGGLLVALLLTAGSWLTGYCLHLPSKLRWLQYLPAAAWMLWTADVGLNLYYMREPGRILSIPLFVVAILGVWAILRRVLSRRPSPSVDRDLRISWFVVVGETLVILICFALPMLHLQRSHRYLRPLTRMQVQLLHDDFEGMSLTAHEHDDISNRFVAGYYAIALARTGQLADKLFDIKLDFDTISAFDYFNRPNQCLNYHVVDCNYHSGLYRAARHYAMEAMTMDGPSLYTLKYLAKMALLDGDMVLARKYFRILHKAPFEGEFLRRFEPMAERPELVQADPELSFVLEMAPELHTLEQFHLKPGFLGYYADLKVFKNKEALLWSTMACLYAKRMPDFLMRCQKLMGTTLPKTVVEGLITQAVKYPNIMEVFPQTELVAGRFNTFIDESKLYFNDRELGCEMLYERYKGFYPYYYFFGNLNSLRKPGDDEQRHNNAGIN